MELFGEFSKQKRMESFTISLLEKTNIRIMQEEASEDY